MSHPSGGYGLAVNDATSVQLSAGKYSGAAGAISIVSGSPTLGNLLGHSSDTHEDCHHRSASPYLPGQQTTWNRRHTYCQRSCNFLRPISCRRQGRSASSILSVTGENVTIQNTGGGYELAALRNSLQPAGQTGHGVGVGVLIWRIRADTFTTPALFYRSLEKM